MSTKWDELVAQADENAWRVDTLGPCTVASPVRHHEFVPENERIAITASVDARRRLTEQFGFEPTFERAGPHASIFHDPSWTRAAIVTAGGLCPGLNNVIKIGRASCRERVFLDV